MKNLLSEFSGIVLKYLKFFFLTRKLPYVNGGREKTRTSDVSGVVDLQSTGLAAIRLSHSKQDRS